MLVGSDAGVIARLDVSTGDILWRQVLSPREQLFVLSVSSSGTGPAVSISSLPGDAKSVVRRAWNMKDGRLMSESVLQFDLGDAALFAHVDGTPVSQAAALPSLPYDLLVLADHRVALIDRASGSFKLTSSKVAFPSDPFSFAALPSASSSAVDLIAAADHTGAAIAHIRVAEADGAVSASAVPAKAVCGRGPIVALHSIGAAALIACDGQPTLINVATGSASAAGGAVRGDRIAQIDRNSFAVLRGDQADVIDAREPHVATPFVGAVPQGVFACSSCDTHLAVGSDGRLSYKSKSFTWSREEALAHVVHVITVDAVSNAGLLSEDAHLEALYGVDAGVMGATFARWKAHLVHGPRRVSAWVEAVIKGWFADGESSVRTREKQV